MKDSNYNIHPHWDSILDKVKSEEAPEVNVRARVRAAIVSKGQIRSEASALDLIVNWFSGFRGLALSGLVGTFLLVTGIYALSPSEDFDEAEVDDVTAFIESGDWSEWL